MVNTYDVVLGGKAVGTASFEKEGLYWKISCCCDVPGDAPYEVTLRAGEQINLGLLVKEEKGYCLTKRISMKRIGEGQPSFTARERIAKSTETFKTIVSDEPFAYLEEIKQCKLEEKNGEVGILLNQEVEDQQIPDSDPSPEFPDESGLERSDHPDP